MKQKQPIALLFSDCHVRKGRTDEFLTNMREMIEVANKHGIKEILFGGDLFYSSSSQTLDVLLAVKQFIRMLKENGMYCTAIPGNHDKVNRDSDESYLDVFECQNFVVFNRDHLQFNDVNIDVFDYRSETGSFRDEFKKFVDEISGDKKQILILHQGINGGMSVHSDSNKELSPELFNEWDTVLVGHYHDRNKVSDNIQYIGASRQMSFGEDEMKGYTCIYDDGSVEFIQNEENMRYITIDATKKNLDKKLELAKGYIDDRYYVRLNVFCTESEKKTIDKALIYELGVSNVVFNCERDDVNVEQSASFEKFDKKELKGKYVDFCEQKEISPELGNKYLDQIN